MLDFDSFQKGVEAGTYRALAAVMPQLDVCTMKQAQAIYGRDFLAEAESKGLVRARRAGSARNSKKLYSKQEIVEAFIYLNNVTLL